MTELDQNRWEHLVTWFKLTLGVEMYLSGRAAAILICDFVSQITHSDTQYSASLNVTPTTILPLLTPIKLINTKRKYSHTFVVPTHHYCIA